MHYMVYALSLGSTESRDLREKASSFQESRSSDYPKPYTPLRFRGLGVQPHPWFIFTMRGRTGEKNCYLKRKLQTFFCWPKGKTNATLKPKP